MESIVGELGFMATSAGKAFVTLMEPHRLMFLGLGCIMGLALGLTQSRGAVPTAVLLDPSGKLGRMYGAKTTPHMFVIDKNGTLQYMGGIDSIATADVSDISNAEPYLKEAMLAVAQGSPVAHSVTRPYGCSVKY